MRPSTTLVPLAALALLATAAAPAQQDTATVTAPETVTEAVDDVSAPAGHALRSVDDPSRAGTGDEVATDKSDGVTLVDEFAYDGIDDLFSGGTDLAFEGDAIYAGQFGDAGGIHIFDGSGAKVRKVGFFDCPGTQNDVAVVEPGLIAMGFHSGGQQGSDCEEEGGGIRLIDVSDPSNPVERGTILDIPGGTHTLKVHPEEPVIYASPGGFATNGGGPTQDGGVQQIIDVSDPDDPVVRGQYQANANGCHDVYFSITEERDRDIVACVGLTESQLWDITDDPFEPETIAIINNPLIFFDHSAAISDDGELLVLGDENFGAHECEGGPTGAMFAYDISTPETPIPVGFFGIDRHPGDDPHVSSSTVDRASWCTAHQYDFIPGTRTMVASWYTGGMNVIDWSDPSSPEEIAHYRVDGPAFENTNYWSAYWHDGRVYANDRGRGMDVLHVEGLPGADDPRRQPREPGKAAEDRPAPPPGQQQRTTETDTTNAFWCGLPAD